MTILLAAVLRTRSLSRLLLNARSLTNIGEYNQPAGTYMLTGLIVEEMYVYYAVATVHAIATATSIRLFIEIPLKAADRYFELYQVHSLPFFHEGINKFILIDEPFSHFAIAEDRQFFTTLTPHMLAKCSKDYYTVCPSDFVLRKPEQQSCLIALFFGKMDIVLRKCKRLILNDKFESIWIRSPDFKYWVYSLSSSTQVTVKCQEQDLSKTMSPNVRSL
jgi:hypothetical protein